MKKFNCVYFWYSYGFTFVVRAVIHWEFLLLNGLRYESKFYLFPSGFAIALLFKKSIFLPLDMPHS